MLKDEASGAVRIFRQTRSTGTGFRRHASRIPPAITKNSSSTQNAAMKRNVMREISGERDVQDLPDVQFFRVHAGVGGLQRVQFDPEFARDGGLAFRRRRQRACAMLRYWRILRFAGTAGCGLRRIGLAGCGGGKLFFGATKLICPHCRLVCVIRVPAVQLVLQLAVFIGELFELLLRGGRTRAWPSRRRRAVVCRWRCAG